MRLEGQGNLRTMDPAASAVIEGAYRVTVLTAAGRFELREESSGELVVYFAEDSQGRRPDMAIIPHGSREIRLAPGRLK